MDKLEKAIQVLTDDFSFDENGIMKITREAVNAIVELLKNQKELLEKKQHDIDELCLENSRLKHLMNDKQPGKKQIWVIKKGNKYLHSYIAGRKSWTTKGSGISIWNSTDKSTAEFCASAVDGIVVEWGGEQE